MKLAEIERNDTTAAIAYAEERLDAGKFTDEDAHSLAMLQDDPSDYFEAFAAAMKARKAANKPVPAGF